MNLSLREQMNILKGKLDVDLFEDAISLDVVKQMGDEDICRCPLPSHNGYDANPSFSFNRAKLIYNCFACGVGGTIIDLVARINDLDYEDAYRFCRGLDDHTAGMDNPFAFGERLSTIFDEKTQQNNEQPLPRFSKSILKDWVSDYCDYFENRGINKDSQDKFILGYDPNHQRGDYVGPAAIIPHFFQGHLVGYQERWINDSRPSGIPKYTNTKGFPKRETLFGYDNVATSGNIKSPVVVVESALTAIYLDQLGYQSVATFGAQVTDTQISLLRPFSWGVILAFDNDSAGRNARDLVGNRLRKTIPVHILPEFGQEKSDLNDMNSKEVEEIIENARPWFMKEI